MRHHIAPIRSSGQQLLLRCRRLEPSTWQMGSASATPGCIMAACIIMARPARAPRATEPRAEGTRAPLAHACTACGAPARHRLHDLQRPGSVATAAYASRRYDDAKRCSRRLACGHGSAGEAHARRGARQRRMSSTGALGTAPVVRYLRPTRGSYSSVQALSRLGPRAALHILPVRPLPSTGLQLGCGALALLAACRGCKSTSVQPQGYIVKQMCM